MYLLNLPLGEFLALLAASSGIVSALYFLEKAKSRRVVSTLRFWQGTGAATAQRRRTRVQEPWSLVLQLLALLLLLMAVAGVQWGSGPAAARNHVLLIDTSAAAHGTVLSEERRLAGKYLATLDPGDRVMVAEVDGTVRPLTPFTPERDVLKEAVDRVRSTEAALSVPQCLRFADAARRWPQGQAGEVVYVGPARVRDKRNETLAGLRMIPVDAPSRGAALTELIAKRGMDPDVWKAVVGLRNYSAEPETVKVGAGFGVTSFSPRIVALRGGQATQLEYEFTATAPGRLRAAIEKGGAANGREASLALPDNGVLSIVAFTRRRGLLDALLGANPRLRVRYVDPGEYRRDITANVLLFDQFVPPSGPQVAGPTLWLDPPVPNSPFAVRRTVGDEMISAWTKDGDLARGLHALDVRLLKAHVFEEGQGFESVAAVSDGSVAIAKDRPFREAAVGFDVLAPELRFQSTTPLLIANLLHWLAPMTFSAGDLSCLPAGLQKVDLDSAATASAVRVENERGQQLPFTIHKGVVEFYADAAGIVRISTQERTREISIGLPEIAGELWRPSGAYAMGIPATHSVKNTVLGLWRGFAISAALLLAIEWFLFGRLASGGRVHRTLLKVVALAVLVIALEAPVLRVPLSRVAIAALVDGSASVPRVETDRAAESVRKLRANAGRNAVIALPFGGEVGTQISPMRTDIEGGLLQGLAALPSGYAPRLLLFSDGNENEGSSVRALRSLTRVGVPIDVRPLGGHGGILHLASVAIPTQAYSGEQIALELVVDSAVSGPGTLSLSLQGHRVATQPVALEKGRNVVSAHVHLNASGTVLVSGILGAFGTTVQFDRVIQMQRAKVLYLSQDEPSADANFLATLASSEFNVSRDAGLLTGGLQGVQLVVLNNVDLNNFTLQQKESLEQYVARGGGLLLIGGEHQVYKEDKKMDVLDRALPAKLGPPRNPEGICVALILDKSSSMEGRKIELARLSAIGVVDNLKLKDTIGVLIFDNSYQWAVPMQKAVDKISMQRLIAGITPDGGTQIAPALTEAYRKVLRVESAYKHIVLLTDGISEEGDSLDLAKEASAHSVTISTVGLGQDVNRSYLEKVAAASGGKSYFLNNPQGLEQILLKDVKDYGGTTAVEKPLTPQVKQKAEVLANVDIEHAPALHGYVRYEAKPQSETLLTIDPEKKDPLFVRWQYGLGRVAVWTSDAKSRWADAWMNWAGFDTFWGNVLHDLLDRQVGTEAQAQVDTATGELHVMYRLRSQVRGRISMSAPSIFAFGPNGFVAPVVLKQSETGVFSGTAQIGPRAGLFTVRPMEETALFPEVGAYRAEDELRDIGVNEPLLRMLAESTGGRYSPQESTEFLMPANSLSQKLELWPALIGLVAALTIVELVARKWRSVVGQLRNATRRSAPTLA